MTDLERLYADAAARVPTSHDYEELHLCCLAAEEWCAHRRRGTRAAREGDAREAGGREDQGHGRPFSEATEVIGGYALVELASHDAAAAFATTVMELHHDGPRCGTSLLELEHHLEALDSVGRHSLQRSRARRAGPK